MAKRKEGSLKGKGFEIFFDEELKSSKLKSSEISESQKSETLEVEKSNLLKDRKSKGQKVRKSESLNFKNSSDIIESFSPPISKRLKERKRSNRVWQRTIYLTDEEEKILLKIKARLFEEGYEVEYSEIIGKALKFLGEKFFTS
jgi:hypothetical protein